MVGSIFASPVGVFGNAGSILLGKSDGMFEKAGHTGDAPLVAADLDGDGNADLVTRSLIVLLGKGDGTFRAPRPTMLPAQVRSTERTTSASSPTNRMSSGPLLTATRRAIYPRPAGGGMRISEAVP
jgi:hypothetical protein